MNRKIALLSSVVVLAVGALYACGNANAPVCTGACNCSGTSCSCTDGSTCTLNGGVDGGTPVDQLPSNISFDCQKNNTCNVACGANCTSHCSNGTTCQGTCGSGCNTSCSSNSTCVQNIGDNSNATCTGTSGCQITAGASSSVTCGGGSSCDVTLSPSSTLDCQGNSTCHVTCADGGCSVNCAGDALCTCANAGCTLNCSSGQTVKDCNGRQACVKNNNCPPGDGGI
ncbi:MAG: hypothetical protein ACJ790_12020 [Myxococcaceae bacterium]